MTPHLGLQLARGLLVLLRLAEERLVLGAKLAELVNFRGDASVVNESTRHGEGGDSGGPQDPLRQTDRDLDLPKACLGMWHDDQGVELVRHLAPGLSTQPWVIHHTDGRHEAPHPQTKGRH